LKLPYAGLPLHRDGRPLALWNRDCTDYPDLNLYGSHPFLLEVRPDGRSHGVLLWNSNAMDAVLTNESASFRTTGGVLDLYFFLGPSPLQVLEQFTRLFGRPAMQPLWALGFHQSKYGYSSIWEMAEVVANYSAAGIPLDVMWGDIDYMERWRDFTFDPVNFPLPALQEFVDDLHEGGRRFVPILDPGIPLLPGYKPYEDGIKRNIFLRDVTGSPYIGEVWPGPVHFPDFISQEGQQWWLDQVRAFYADVKFDGLWVDMNEPSNFCTGHVCELPPPELLDFVDPSAKPFFTFGTEPPACQLQCWSLEPYLKQWLLQEQSFSHMPSADASGALLGSLVKGAVVQNGTRPWQDTGLERHEWEVFVKVDTPPYAIANNNVRLPPASAPCP
jgi:alpha-D-xyloside xylohydrolase